MPSFLHSFNKHAKTYGTNSIVQQNFALLLLERLNQKSYVKVLDLGAGSGTVAQILERYSISIKDFIALDNSINMLELHPTHSKNIQKVFLEHADFEKYAFKTYDLIVSSSSLQWAKDLKDVLEKIAFSSKEVALVIHTDFSLHEVHEFLGTTSPLRNLNTLKTLLQNAFLGFDIDIEIKRMVLEFKSQQDFFNHLKKSGLLGGSMLTFAQKKCLFKRMPFERLSYEALLFWGNRRS
ncbi:methyltransferase domain-containing protein [Helicobacter cetorum]|uniref:methyltransferase domain-containing protein n=1 Tax=Helicobacter cetorum TaxID=138563 RepID=UPI000CF0D505|nr:methyltransferase domain-containing protein [Helicobacter cetorum]